MLVKSVTTKFSIACSDGTAERLALSLDSKTVEYVLRNNFNIYRIICYATIVLVQVMVLQTIYVTDTRGLQAHSHDNKIPTTSKDFSSESNKSDRHDINELNIRSPLRGVGSTKTQPTDSRRLDEIANALNDQVNVEYEQEFPYNTTCEYFEARPNVKIALAYHVGMSNNWKNVVHDQLQTLHQCGLGHSASQLLLSYSSSDEEKNASEIIDLMKPYDFSFQIEGAVKSLDEPWGGGFVNTVHEYCQNNLDAVVYYFHNFGVDKYDPNWRSSIDQEYSYSRVLYWRKMMEYFTLEQPQLCLDAILRDDGQAADACGSNLLKWPKRHYSGNFWVASCNYLATLPPINTHELDLNDWQSKIADQLWIGSNPEERNFLSWWQFSQIDVWGFSRYWLQPNEYRADITVEQQEQIHHEYYHDAPTSPNYPHPHAGAKDADGHWGYVANVTHLRQWMIQKYCKRIQDQNQSSCILPVANSQEFDKACVEPPDTSSSTWDVLVNRVQVSDPVVSEDKEYSLPKVLCAVYTYQGHHDHIRGIAETWGWRCDGFFAASTVTTQTFDNANFADDYTPPPVEMINLPHEGPEEYGNMWQKTRSILGYMHDNYLNDFDYFYVVGDDTHLIVENLKSFLLESSSSSEVPFFSGMIGGENIVDGGGGYVMSRGALGKFVSLAIPTCEANTISPTEDHLVGRCMSQIGINVTDAADTEGKQRFFRDGPDRIMWQFYVEHLLKSFGEKHGYKTGSDLVSKSAIAFHLIKGVDHMKRHHSTLYRSCPSGTKLTDTLLAHRIHSNV